MEIGVGMANIGFTPMEQSTSVNKGEIKQEAYQQAVQPGSQGVQTNEPAQEKLFVQAIEKANKKFLGDGKELSFSVHEKTKQIMVKIVDKQSKEVVKEIPPEKILDMVAEMCENAGLFIDERK